MKFTGFFEMHPTIVGIFVQMHNARGRFTPENWNGNKKTTAQYNGQWSFSIA